MSVKNSAIFDKQLLSNMKLGAYNLIKPLLNENLCKESDSWGTLLHYAALYGSAYCIMDLVKRGSDVNSLTRHGETALMIALQRNFFLAVETLLLAKADVDIVGSDGISALQMLFQSPLVCSVMVNYFLLKMGSEASNTEEFVQRLIESGCTAYHAAYSYSGYPRILEALLERGIDINSRDVHSRTALMAAAKNNDLELIKMLLNKGADVNALSDVQMSALHWAALAGNKAMLEMLLNAGADVDATCHYNRYTALFQVFVYSTTEEQADTCAELLLVHGALPQNSNHTPILNVANRKPHSYRSKLLVAHIAMLDLMGLPIIESLTGSTMVEYHMKYPEFGEYHDLCQQVLVMPIVKSLTLLDFLNETERQMRIHVRNQNFMSQLADFHLEENLAEHCPLYSKKLEKRISNAKRTLELENKAIPILFKIIGRNGYDVAREVICYLEKTDLENLCQIED